MKNSECLLENGWFPSPTIFSENAWEHEVYSHIPESFGVASNRYESTLRRVPESHAVSIQLLLEAFENYGVKQQLINIGDIMPVLVKSYLKFMLGK